MHRPAAAGFHMGHLPGQHQRRVHACRGGHGDVGREPVADHHAAVGGQAQHPEYRLQHLGAGLAEVRLARHAGAGLDGGDDRGRVGLAAPAGHGAEAGTR